MELRYCQHCLNCNGLYQDKWVGPQGKWWIDVSTLQEAEVAGDCILLYSSRRVPLPSFLRNYWLKSLIKDYMVSPSRFFIIKGWANVQTCQITQEKGINSKVSSLKSNTQSTQEARYNQSSDYISENVFPKFFQTKKKKIKKKLPKKTSSLSCVISPSLLENGIVILSCKVYPHYRGCS